MHEGVEGAPDERKRLYPHVWENYRVDRFYGQDMTPEQVEGISIPWASTDPPKRPLWATGLVLLANRKERVGGYAYEGDFGLETGSIADDDIFRCIFLIFFI